MSQPFLYPDWFEPLTQASANGQNGVMRPSEVIELFLQHLETRVQSGRLSSQNYANSRRDLQRFATFADGKPKLTDDDLVAFIFRRQYRSDWTKRRILGLIIRCFKWAAHPKRAYIAEVPFERPDDLRFSKPRRPHATAAEYVALMRAAHARGTCKGRDRGNQAMRIMLFVLWNTSLRPEEARELDVSQFFPESRCIKIQDHKTIGQMAEPEAKIVGLDKCTCRLLGNLIRRLPVGQSRILLAQRGQPWTKNGLDCRFADLRKKAGITRKITPYSFRHGGATEADEGGMNDRAIADQLGHTSTNLIKTYSHAAQQERHMRRIADEMRSRRRVVRRRLD